MSARNLQVETPLLSPSAGGALARPFLTRSWAWDTELALRIAPELFLKVRWLWLAARRWVCGCGLRH